ncbi:MAG TPA: GNAT family N-acetyltransferase [Bacteroidota bacterium]
MNIIDLNEANVSLYTMCLEDWSDDVKEAGNRKETWYRQMKDKGLRVKLAVDDRGTIGGMIQYIPIEHSFAEGTGLYLINCIWVHGHKQGRGNFQGRGMGVALLEAAENDARRLGAKGMVAWGLMMPVFMRASWFKRHGYKRADRMGMMALLWKPFSADAVAPQWIRPTGNPLPLEKNKVTVTAMCNGWCTAQNMAMERARRAAADPQFAGRVVVRDIDTSDRRNFLQWGISDALYVNKKQVRTGPPPSYDKIHKLIAKQVNKLL